MAAWCPVVKIAFLQTFPDFIFTLWNGKIMKLVRYGKPGKEKPGLIDADGKLRDLSGKIDDLTPEQLSDKALAKLAKLNPEKLPLVKGKPRLGVPVSFISKYRK